MKKIGVITTGGDAPGMNPAIRSVVRTAIGYGFRVTGIRRGWWGLLEKDYREMDLRSVSGIINQGGTILHTVRCPLFYRKRYIALAARNLKDVAPDGLVVIGGDGSMTAALSLWKTSNVPVVGIPASIDNDIPGTEDTIGFDTATNTALEAIDKIRDTAASHQRVFIVEVMGRNRGFLALNVGLTSGAEFILLPELKWDKAGILKEIKTFSARGKTSCIIVMAEGAGDPRSLKDYLQKRLDVPVRLSRLGYVQRGGAPTVDSRFMGSVFGFESVMLLRKRRGGVMLAISHGKISRVPLSYVIRAKKSIDHSLIRISRRLAY